MHHRYSILLIIVLIGVTTILQTFAYAGRYGGYNRGYSGGYSNAYYGRQQMMRSNQMAQQRAQMAQAQRRQMEATRQQQRAQSQQMQQQRRVMQQRQQAVQQQMRQRQQQATLQRQKMAKHQRQIQQKILNQRQQPTKQQKRQRQQVLHQQKKVKVRKVRLKRLEKNRIQQKRKANKNNRQEVKNTVTFATLASRYSPKLPSLQRTPKLAPQKKTIKQFRKERKHKLNQQRVTKQLEAQRKAVQANLKKLTKQRINLKTNQKKKKKELSNKQKLAQANFSACQKGKNCGTGACSFHGDTLVMTTDGFEPIKSLVSGQDKVWARNEYTGEMAWKPVTAHYTNLYEETVEIIIRDTTNDSTQIIRSNRIHPFYVGNTSVTSQSLTGTNETGQWIEAQHLRYGQHLLDSNGDWLEVVQTEIIAKPLQAYNLTVANFNTYFVKGPVNDIIAPVWVHNDCERVNPNKIQLSKAGVEKHYKTNPSINKLITKLKSGLIKPKDIPPIRVVQKDGKLITLDNRRLFALQSAGIKKIPIKRVSLKNPKTAKEFAKQYKSVKNTKNVSVAKNGNKFWNKSITFQGNKVYQRNDLIDPKLVDARGRSNIDRMKKGLAPIGTDGKSINLHHMIQRHKNGIAEMSETFHKQKSKIIHINPKTTPSGIDRKAFNKWRSNYWKSRANDFLKGKSL